MLRLLCDDQSGQRRTKEISVIQVLNGGKLRCESCNLPTAGTVEPETNKRTSFFIGTQRVSIPRTYVLILLLGIRQHTH